MLFTAWHDLKHNGMMQGRGAMAGSMGIGAMQEQFDELENQLKLNKEQQVKWDEFEQIKKTSHKAHTAKYLGPNVKKQPIAASRQADYCLTRFMVDPTVSCVVHISPIHLNVSTTN